MEIKGGLQETKKDRRDFSYKKSFGSISLSELPKEFYVSLPLIIKNQRDSDMCTAYGITAVSEDQEEIILSPEYQFAKIKEITGKIDEFGADLRSAAKSVIKFGSIKEADSPYKLGVQERDFIADWNNWNRELDNKATDYKKGSYFWIDGSYDFFNNIRVALWLNKAEKRSVFIGAEWHAEWSDIKDGIIKTYDPKSFYFGHAFKIYGWKEINGEPYLVAQLSNGKDFGDNGKFYFHSSVINSNAFRYGALTFKDVNQEEIKKIQWNIITLLYDVIKRYQQLIKLQLGKIWG